MFLNAELVACRTSTPWKSRQHKRRFGRSRDCYCFKRGRARRMSGDVTDFGSKDITTSDAAGDFVIFNIGQRLNILKTGINYKF